MPRYINAEEALQSFCAECNHTIKCEDCDIKYHLEEFVPTADVAEVKRGRWLKIEKQPHLMRCSVCGSTSVEGNLNYCPRCGAKMDEVEE